MFVTRNPVKRFLKNSLTCNNANAARASQASQRESAKSAFCKIAVVTTTEREPAMSSRKICEYVHPGTGQLCHRDLGHMGKCLTYDKDGNRYEWKDKSDGPDSLKELFTF